MTEKTETTEDQGGGAAPEVAQTDWFLQMLVSAVNASTDTYGITLQMGGLLVTGTMVGVVQYFEGFAETFSSGITDPALKKSLSEPFRELARHTQKVREEAGELPPPTFIHLKNAHFFQPGASHPIPGNNVDGVFWRGRISEVDGFMLGVLGPGAE